MFGGVEEVLAVKKGKMVRFTAGSAGMALPLVAAYKNKTPPEAFRRVRRGVDQTYCYYTIIIDLVHTKVKRKSPSSSKKKRRRILSAAASQPCHCPWIRPNPTPDSRPEQAFDLRFMIFDL
jgi:hypothetical protein